MAQGSAAAAKEIKLLIGDSVDKVHEGSTLVEQAVTMAEVVESVRRVIDIMAEQAASMQQQAATPIRPWLRFRRPAAGHFDFQTTTVLPPRRRNDVETIHD